MYILGLNAYHGDSSACLFRDGALIAASEEERFRRIKHWAGMPTEAIRFCLQTAGIDISQVDHIAISRDPKANMSKKMWHLLTEGFSIKALKARLENRSKVKDFAVQLAEDLSIERASIKAQIHHIEHHRAHLASAFFVSPFEEAALLSIDGFGDFTSTMTGIGRGNQMEILGEVNYPHSIGVFYSAFTQWLGFPHYGDEYKVMGLAPYGQPLFVDKVKQVIQTNADGTFQLVKKYFRHVKEGVEMSWNGGSPHIGVLYSKELESLFGPARKSDEPLTQTHKDIAASVQRVCESVIIHLLNSLHKKTGLEAVCIAGGVAQNSVANGKILSNTPFKKIYIPPAGHDAGTAIGAALFVRHQIMKLPRSIVNQSPYTGSRFSDEEVAAFLKDKAIDFIQYPDSALFDIVSRKLVDGGVIGWFQGAAEFGPRALGNRSIIADPRREDAKELLNLKIKRRESFRPFAPSILSEYVQDYFDIDDQVPYMEKVFPIREEMRVKIPAVTHVDGTGRLQTVTQSSNPRYHGLISAFYALSGVPILLNTSFNENEPIVDNPQQALDCYLRTKMDMLVMGNCVILRP